MKAFELWHNGQKIALAGLEDGIVEVTFTIRNQMDPIWLDARGRDHHTGGHADWLHQPIKLGDEFKLRLVDVPPPDPPAGAGELNVDKCPICRGALHK